VNRNYRGGYGYGRGGYGYGGYGWGGYGWGGWSWGLAVPFLIGSTWYIYNAQNEQVPLSDDQVAEYEQNPYPAANVDDAGYED
jgi:hypothetical protein